MILVLVISDQIYTSSAAIRMIILRSTHSYNKINLDLLKMIFYFLHGKSTTWGIYREYV